MTPGTKEEGRTKDDHERKLTESKASEYRAMTARLNYLTSDRPDIAFSVKELARTMSSPTEGCWERLKRLGRYLVTRPHARITFPWQNSPKVIQTYTDADWA